MTKTALLLLAVILAVPASAQERAASQAADDFASGSGAGALIGKMKAFTPTPAPVLAQADPGAGAFSDGYRMGLLSKFSVKGWVNKSGEGELLLGQDSSIAYKGSGDDKKQINPWAFSADPAKAPAVQALAGQYVVVHYHQVMVSNPLKRDTDYNLQEITAVDTASKPKTACEAADAKGQNSSGFRMARIVKASRKGVSNKSYEIMLQVGGSGNDFHEMTVSSDAMFDCAVKWLKSGGKAKVWYKQSFLYNPLTRDTGYDISKIEPLPSLD